MRHLTATLMAIVMGFVFTAGVFAADKTDCVYGSKIDSAVCFYEARLYLIDSDYKTLADIGRDAEKMIAYLKTNRKRLIEDMKVDNVGFYSRQITAYVVNKARYSNMVAFNK